MSLRPSTVLLSLGLAGALTYAGFLHLENARLRQDAVVSPAAAEEAGAAEIATAASGQPASPEAAAASRAPFLDAGSPRAEAAEEAERDDRRGEDWRERRRERMARMAAAFDDPEMRLDMVERQIQRVDQQFAGFFRTLQLGPEQMDTLRTLMAERGVIDWETRMRRFAAGGESEREQIEAAERLQHEMIDGEIESLLGEAEAERLKDYADSLPYRNEVEALANSLSFTQAPLNEAQTEQLVQAMQSVSEEYDYSVDLSNLRGREGAPPTSEEVARYFEERSARDALVLERAASALNDEQLAAFAERQIADRERDRRRMEFMLQGRGGPARP